MADGSLLNIDYSEKELNKIQKKQQKLHQKAWAFIKKVCPFQK
jgi:hypothetical protein